jgi:hypothetical protein
MHKVPVFEMMTVELFMFCYNQTMLNYVPKHKSKTIHKKDALSSREISLLLQEASCR